jgi:hypothetical protein
MWHLLILIKRSFAISRLDSPEVCQKFSLPSNQSNCAGNSPVIGRAQGWRWRAPAAGG